MTSRAVTILGFAAISLAAITVDLCSRIKGSRLASCNDLLRARQVGRVGRLATFVAWFWLGFHLLAR